MGFKVSVRWKRRSLRKPNQLADALPEVYLSLHLSLLKTNNCSSTKCCCSHITRLNFFNNIPFLYRRVTTGLFSQCNELYFIVRVSIWQLTIELRRCCVCLVLLNVQCQFEKLVTMQLLDLFHLAILASRAWLFKQSTDPLCCWWKLIYLTNNHY